MQAKENFTVQAQASLSTASALSTKSIQRDLLSPRSTAAFMDISTEFSSYPAVMILGDPVGKKTNFGKQSVPIARDRKDAGRRLIGVPTLHLLSNGCLPNVD